MFVNLFTAYSTSGSLVYLFLCTVFLLAILLPFINKLELSYMLQLWYWANGSLNIWMVVVEWLQVQNIFELWGLKSIAKQILAVFSCAERSVVLQNLWLITHWCDAWKRKAIVVWRLCCVSAKNWAKVWSIYRRQETCECALSRRCNSRVRFLWQIALF